MKQRRAVVVGGSIAGLCAARVLSRHFAEVIVLDRDAFPTTVADRSGVPQGRHVHALLARGLAELDRLCPGFERELRDAGAVDIDFGMDFAALRPFGWVPRVSIGLHLLFASRALIETTLRRLVLEAANVELRERTTVRGLTVADGAARRVTGVRLAAGGGDDTLAADLVVDASGRGSRAPEWLRAIGLEPPVETVVDSLAGYSTRWFQAPDRSRWPGAWWWKGIWLDPVLPHDLRAGVLFPVEGDRWIVTLGGLGGQYPPADEEGFTTALGNLRSPVLAEAVRLATPISPVYGHRAMANRFRHYERWERRLPGFLAVADSACAFNPVYGQGMTAAALCASVLEECLGKTDVRDPVFAARFFTAQARRERDLWDLATGADFLVPQTIGERPLLSKVSVPYFEALLWATQDDEELLRRFVEVINLVRPARSLFAPVAVTRVLAGLLRRRIARGSRVDPVPDMPPKATVAS